jgi:hypothetical protein
MRRQGVTESEARRLRVCLHFTTCPSYHVSDCVAADQEIVQGSAILTSPPCPFRTWNRFPPFFYPCINSSEVGKSQQLRQQAGSCDGFRKRGCRISDRRMLEPELQPSPPATYAEIGPSCCRSAQVQAHKRNPPPLLGQRSSPKRRHRRHAINLRRS